MPGLGEPIPLPYMSIPEAPPIGVPTLSLPKADIPSYKPLVVPPSSLQPPPGIKGTQQEGNQPATKSAKPSKAPEVNYVNVPFLDQEVPVPSNEILVTAVSTATVSVAATLAATAVFKKLVSIFKPIIKNAWTRITKSKKKETEEKESSSSSSSSGQPDS